MHLKTGNDSLFRHILYDRPKHCFILLCMLADRHNYEWKYKMANGDGSAVCTFAQKVPPGFYPVKLDLICRLILILIYLSTAIGLTPGDSGTVHTINT